MAKTRRWVLKGALSATALLAAKNPLDSAFAAERETFTLATATRGGTYYPVGVAISTLVKAKLSSEKAIDMSARISAGSIANIGMLQSNEAQFAIVLGIVGTLARSGEGPFASTGPVSGLRSVTALWPNVEHFLVRRSHRKTGDLRDFLALKDQSVSIGPEGSGALAATRYLLRGQGIDPDAAFSNAALDYADSVNALMQGKIQGASLPGGLPVTAVTQLYVPEDRQVTLLRITDAQLRAADGGLGLWTRWTIPVGTYPAQSEEIPTMAQSNVLIVREDVSERAVYEIVKTVYDHLDFLQGIHPATKALKLEEALRGLTLPLHPGAATFYREAGLTIPENLLP